jgi:hypothetical protein
VTRRRIALALALVFATAGVARAHLGSTKYLSIEPTPEGARVVADLDPVDVAYELDVDDPVEARADDLLPRSAEIQTWLETALTMRSAGGACASVAGEPETVAMASREGTWIRVAITFDCPEPRTGLALHDGAVFDSDPQHEAIVRVGDSPSVLRVGRQDVAIGDAAAGDTVLAFLVEGALHLVTGYDHVLFLLSLLLVAGELAARHGVKKAGTDVALVVTGFTIGHSVTLIAAALDVVTLPSRLVESAIAASIVIVAAINVVRPEARRGLPWLAVGFGLIHGFGFSSVLRELVLPAGERIAALLAFNVGIELAQLAIVALVLGPLAWAGRKTWYRRAVIQGGSVVVGLIGLAWFVERAFGLG